MPAPSYVVPSYAVYLVLSILATVWVAHTLHRNGRAFLVDAFDRQEQLADSVNHLLVVGFYLINLGWIIRTLQTAAPVPTIQASIELLSNKVGTVLVVLGVMHFVNVLAFERMRRRAIDRAFRAGR